MSERVFIIGAGKVGRGLAFAMRAVGLQVLGVHARTPRDGATSSGALGGVLSDANVILIAVSDAAVNDVCRDLAATARADPGAVAHGSVVLHTSGIATPAAYAELRAMGLACGTFHPLVPFATAERGAAAVRDGWVGIEGDATACATARRLAAALGARTMNIPSGAKQAYHAAAVMASNFPVVLAALAVRTLARAGVEERAAEQVVQRLMQAAVTNLEYGPPASVLTGPAARGDEITIAAHRAAIGGDREAAAVYDALTRAAMSLTAEQRVLVHDASSSGRDKAKGGRTE